MAKDTVVELGSVDVIQKQWIVKSLECQRAALVRSRTKEMVGSDIHALRGKEIDALDHLIQRWR